MSLDPGDRTYYVSDERLRAFARLSAAEKLAWIEQCSAFIRLARIKPAAAGNRKPVGHAPDQAQTASLHQH